MYILTYIQYAYGITLIYSVQSGEHIFFFILTKITYYSQGLVSKFERGSSRSSW